MQRTWVRVVLWILTLGMCVLIFGFSAQDGEESMKTSDVIAKPITNEIASRRPKMTTREYRLLYNNVQHYVRKTAHFTEYAILGVLVFLLGKSYAWRCAPLISVLFSLVYASGDEWHQKVSGVRTGMWQDVVLDTSGSLIGILLCMLIIHFYRRYRQSKEQVEHFS